MTIIEFLLARIAEDKAVALAAQEVDWLWPPMLDDRDVGPTGTDSNRAYFATDKHVKRHDPARVLAECEAKRRIVERCRPRYAVLYRESERLLASAFGQETMKTVGHSGPIWPFEGAEIILCDLAAVYADHPDYREEWRP